LTFLASDIPTNPIEELISGIRKVTKGIPAEVTWNLEPAAYYFYLEPIDDQFTFRISFADGNAAQKQPVFETQGNYEDIIAPFYRALKIFFTKAIEPSHWPKTDECEIEKLTNVVKSR
jgi:hypothetical protein